MADSSHPNIKYDWYQSETHVVLNVLVKQIKPENVRIDIVDSELTCRAKLNDDTEFSLVINLAHKVQPNLMQWKVFPSKIEIKLRKGDGTKWEKLEKKADESKSLDSDAAEEVPPKPQKKDWDKIAFEIKKQEEEEKPEGEAALNQLFQKIYADGSDDIRKAMNKSFLESGGTVLSTSWNDVGSKTVEMKPPDGMEFKKWE